MRVDRIIASMLRRRNISTVDASRQIGKSDAYLSKMISSRTMPKANTLAGICERLGFSLVVRDDDDGFEFTVDPPDDF